ncbi:MAG: DUF2917 domain-containing protein [Rubrivivax sp.]|nr:DUF2917 domain-containing protein [Rubrivivax sp.]
MAPITLTSSHLPTFSQTAATAVQAAMQHILPVWRRSLGRLADAVTAASAEDAVAYQVPVAHGAIRRFERPNGLRFTCMRGALWLTLDDEVVDHVLHAGQSFEARSGRRVIVYGLEDAVLRVGPSAGSQALRLVMQAD